jgi:hypothetical protein
LLIWVRCRTRRSRPRNTIAAACCASDFTGRTACWGAELPYRLPPHRRHRSSGASEWPSVGRRDQLNIVPKAFSEQMHITDRGHRFASARP